VDLAGPRHRARLSFARTAHVDDLQTGFETAQLGQLLDGEAGARLDQVGPAGEQLGGFGQLPDHAVVPDSAEANLRLGSQRRIADQDDIAIGL
jgi:hypothetical protein